MLFCHLDSHFTDKNNITVSYSKRISRTDSEQGPVAASFLTVYVKRLSTASSIE